MSVRFQHYEVPQRPDGSPWELGRGAMGVTYKAFDTNLRSPVALKVINSAFLQNENARQRFLREARAAAQLRHPNVAAIFYLGHEGVENYFYAMELIDGETFEQLVTREGPLPPAAALELTLQVTRALIAAHAVGLIHRDIKPSNLMIMRQEGEPHVKVIDFGLAKAIGQEPEPNADGTPGNALTRTVGQGFVGTPYFASPEQLEGLEVDTRSDIYSVGITLWYLVSGQTPFRATSMARVVSEHLSKPPPFDRLGTLPECVVSLLRKMLEKDPSDRQQTPTELRDEIFACLRQLPPSDLLRHASLAASAAPVPSPAGLAGDATLHGLPPATCEIGPLSVGTTLSGRLALQERAGTETFRATDGASGAAALVRTLPAPALAVTQALFPRWQTAARTCPPLLTPLAFGQSPDGGGYVAAEWVEGASTLLDLMKQRGALTLGETLALLEPMAWANLELERQGLEGAHLDPAHVLLAPAAAGSVPTPRLLPAELFAEAVTETAGNRTVLATSATIPSLESGADPRAFGRLACELLGGPARNWLEPDSGRFTPLSTLNEAGNLVLRRCLFAPSRQTGTGDGFASGSEFVAALRRSADGLGVLPSAPAVEAAAGMQPPVARVGSTAASLSAAPAPTPAAVESAVERPAKPAPSRLPLVIGAVFTVLAVVAAVFFLGSRPGGSTPGMPGVAGTPAATAPAKLVRPAGVDPLQPGAPWTNTLGMRFAPVTGGALHAGVWLVRAADFAAFIEATRFDATGGMYSIGPLGRRQQLGRSWKEPGFVQTPEHPVVGVNVSDAEAFCAWLTRRESDWGLLPAGRRYRLPTDEEWSALAGLPTDDPKLTPEQRGARAGDVFPWGTTWPPPRQAGNYAGTESGLPEAQMLAGYTDGFARTSPVGTFAANALGLHDLGGNVWEWCADRFKAEANWRVVRGGSWLTGTKNNLRLGARDGYNPAFRHDDIGFRCVIAAEP